MAVRAGQAGTKATIVHGSATPTHIDALDGLRGLAALTVFVSHYSNTTGLLGGMFGWGGGQMGVMLFFSLSGYLLAMLYLDSPLTFRSAMAFYIRRVARVVPLYLTVVVIGYLASILRTPSPGIDVTDHNIWEHLLFLRAGGVLWTIPIELHFYLIFPALWWLFRSSRTAFYSLTVALMIVGILLSTACYQTLPGHIHYFIAGVLVSRFRLRLPAALADVSMGLATVAYLMAFPQLFPLYGRPAPGLSQMWGMPMYLGITIGLLSLATTSGLARSGLGRFPLSAIGTVSYSLYLLHEVAISAAYSVVHSDAYAFFIAITLAITLASASWRFLERPAQRALLHFALRAPPIIYPAERTNL